MGAPPAMVPSAGAYDVADLIATAMVEASVEPASPPHAFPHEWLAATQQPTSSSSSSTGTAAACSSFIWRGNTDPTTTWSSSFGQPCGIDTFNSIDACTSTAVLLARKRLMPTVATQPPTMPHPPDDGVETLLPKMKRLRLRPSLGQLRLQREQDVVGLAPNIQVCIEPEQLRAIVAIAGVGMASAGCQLSVAEPVQVHMEFPPQYPHRPPRVVQVAPLQRLPAWQYGSSGNIELSRLADRSWSSCMGVTDIVHDLVQALNINPGGNCFGNSNSFGVSCIAGTSGNAGGMCHQVLFPACSPPHDVEMA